MSQGSKFNSKITKLTLEDAVGILNEQSGGITLLPDTMQDFGLFSVTVGADAQNNPVYFINSADGNAALITAELQAA